MDIRRRRAIAVDETNIKVQGRWLYRWAAIDIDTWEVLYTWVSQGRSGFEALGFLRRVLEVCEGCRSCTWTGPRGTGGRWTAGGPVRLLDLRTSQSHRAVVRGPETEDQEVLQEVVPQRRPGEGQRVGRVVRELLRAKRC
ncbi:MAG: DDE-type integrase/transposase/recombinase [Candidatus Thermoplasmatota archaeon]|nr:DDE-type integrase/transposase/recombinase [Candidatus Thermoplasmatota archaeon]